MHSNRLRWTYRDEKGAGIRDLKRHAGIFYTPEDSESSRTMDTQARNDISSLLLLQPQDIHPWKEIGFRNMVAHLFADVWSRRDIAAHW